MVSLLILTSGPSHGDVLLLHNRTEWRRFRVNLCNSDAKDTREDGDRSRPFARSTWRTVDAIWHGLGDRSVDFAYYTKRATLGYVYGATVLCWLGDDSEDHTETWSFLDRRIEDVMTLSGLNPKSVVERLARFGRPSRLGAT